MLRFLFTFGYCNPAQWKANDELGWDDECSDSVAVLAENAEYALAWGREVAEAFIGRAFSRAGWHNPPSWKDGKLAHWVDQCPDAGMAAAFADARPNVALDEMPSFDTWVQHFK